MKPLLKWSCIPLTDGWLMFAVDVDLAQPHEPECLLGLRRAVHPYYFRQNVDSVIGFAAVIAEMDSQIRKGCGVSATPHSASRAHAFGG